MEEKSISIKFKEEDFVTNNGRYKVLIPLNLTGNNDQFLISTFEIVFDLKKIGEKWLIDGIKSKWVNPLNHDNLGGTTITDPVVEPIRVRPPSPFPTPGGSPDPMPDWGPDVDLGSFIETSGAPKTQVESNSLNATEGWRYLIESEPFLNAIKEGYNEYVLINKFQDISTSSFLVAPDHEKTINVRDIEAMKISGDDLINQLKYLEEAQKELKTNDFSPESADRVNLTKKVNEIRDNWRDLYGSINRTYDALDLSDQFSYRSENVSENFQLAEILEESFIYELFKSFYLEPTIVRMFFSKPITFPDFSALGIEMGEITGFDVNSNLVSQGLLNSRKIFNPKYMEISLIRKDNYIAKNNDYIESLLDGGDPEKPADKAEGVYCYLKGDQFKSNQLVQNDFVLGWVPFVSYVSGEKTEVSCISTRKVKFNFKGIDKSLDAEFTEYGWIFPDAMNEMNFEGGADWYDNKLLFHWVGDTLGCESVFKNDDSALHQSIIEKAGGDQWTQSGAAYVEDFVNKYLYTKEVSLPDGQIPLKEGVVYNYSLVPINILGDWPIQLKGEKIEKSLDLGSDFTNGTSPFYVIDPVSPPELVVERQKKDDKPQLNPILLKHKLKGRVTELQNPKEIFLLPPKVDLNVARWLGTFELGQDSDFDNVFDWVVKTEKEVVPVLTNPIARSLWYTFDQRILSRNLKIELYELVYDETQQEIEVKLGNSHLIKPKDLGWKTMSDVRGIKLVVKSVAAREDWGQEEVGTEEPFLITDAKYIQVNIPEGKRYVFKCGYELGEEVNPMASLRIINAVSDLKENDVEGGLKLEQAQIYSVDSADNSPKYEAKFELKNVNFNIVEYFYLFRRYRRVNPSEWNLNDLPKAEEIVKRRGKVKEINNLTVGAETDDNLKDFLKSENLQELPKKEEVKEIEYLEDEENSKSATLVALGKKKGVFSPDNVFELHELFTEIRAELLAPKKVKSGEKDIQVIENKIGFGKINRIGDVELLAELNDTDCRAKKIDYISAKLYSKHLSHFKGEFKDLLDMDFNVFAETRAPLIKDSFGKNNQQIITEVKPPKFDTELIFLSEEENDVFSNAKQTNHKRRTLLMITFDKDELNLLSDEEYIGIDFSREVRKVGGIDAISNYTELGVDFTYNKGDSSDRTVYHNIGPNSVNFPLDYEGDSLLFKNDSSDSSLRDVICIEVEQVDSPDGEKVINKFAFTKPMFLYNEQKGFILWDVSNMMSNENELDPFLKLSLCRGYFLSPSREEVVRTQSSVPTYVQLSSTRQISVSLKGEKIEVGIGNKYPQEKMRVHYLVAFYKGREKTDFETPLVLKSIENGKEVCQSYILLSEDSNMKKLVSKNNNKYQISNENGLVELKEEGGVSLFDPSQYRMKLFEFHTYQNLLDTPDKTILNLIQEDGFNPFDDSNFKLIFTI